MKVCCWRYDASNLCETEEPEYITGTYYELQDPSEKVFSHEVEAGDSLNKSEEDMQILPGAQFDDETLDSIRRKLIEASGTPCSEMGKR